MIDDTRFEARLSAALREYAEKAVLPLDPDEIAGRAMGARPKRARWVRPALVATLGIAGVAAVAVLLSQLLVGPIGIGGPRLIRADELPGIVANAANTPGTWDQTLDEGGAAALQTPMRSGRTADLEGFVDGRTTEMCGEEPDGDLAGCLTAWVALFETPEQARTAYDFYVAELESPDGWGFDPIAREPSELGDEAVLYTYVIGDDGFWLNGFHFWRQGNLLLAAVGIAEMDVDALQVIAEAMEARALAGN
jgi:hypothetical protein